MLKIVQHLLDLSSAVLKKNQADELFDEALVYYQAKDYKKALPLMTEAAELGSLHAMSILGSMYLLGNGVSENGVEAERWLKLAVEGGYEDAVSVLGMAYATGKAGIKVNLRLAREMLMAAADNGDQQSVRMLDMMDNGKGMFRKSKR